MSASLLDAVAAAGLSPFKALDLEPDGKLHRYRVQGDKPGSRNGWYVLHSRPIAAGAFGSWKTGETHTWREASTTSQTPAERAELQRQMRSMQEARAAEQAQVRGVAQQRAAKLWSMARPAHNGHPYLQRKGIDAIGVRQLREALLVPARDEHGALHTLQFIGPDGAKRFLSGGRIAGCYFAIGRPQRTIVVCEGFATACTIFQATGLACAAAFSCSNMLSVARALRAKFPQLRIIVAADDDSATPGNPGLTHARAAARAVRGFLAAPRFKEAA
jgi:putative DNA primase/helicase